MDAAARNQQITQRVGRPYVIEAVRMLEAGEGTLDGIDAALLAAGYSSGPFQLLDSVGLDVDLAIDRELQARFDGSARFDPPGTQVAMVEEGRLGQSTGRGFYRYGPSAMPEPDVFRELTAEVTAGRLVERLELGVVNEAYRAVEEGMASPPHIDEVMREAGFPYGPFERVDQLGMRVVIERLRALHVLTEDRSDDQYLVASALWQIATA